MAKHPIVVGATGVPVGIAISAVVTLRRTPEAGMVQTNAECYQICVIDNGTYAVNGLVVGRGLALG